MKPPLFRTLSGHDFARSIRWARTAPRLRDLIHESFDNPPKEQQSIMKPRIHYRQGDVLIERIDSLPAKLKPMPSEQGKVILAHGEVTGHAHAIADKQATQFTSPEHAGDTFLEVRAAVAALKHEEHRTIKLPAGNYRVTRQREYSPEEIRNVAD